MITPHPPLVTGLQRLRQVVSRALGQAWRSRRWRWPRRLALVGALSIALPIIGFHMAVRAGSFPDAYLEKSTMSSLVIRDERGIVLGRRASETGYKKRWVALDDISPHVLHATLASEDADFYEHGGVDWSSIGRAAWLNLRGGRLAFGGSTITMQLTRLIAGTERNFSGKLAQSVLAARLERKLSKNEILEHYLNRVYYGHGAWGIEEAAQRYLGKHASELSAGEAALLVVFPRGPKHYDPLKHWERAIERRDHILGLMRKRGYLESEEVALAKRAPIALSMRSENWRAPHFAAFVQERLPAAFRAGGKVQTSLDWQLQTRVEEAVARHVDKLAHRNISQAAVVVLRNSDGAILSMVGSRDVADREHNGAFNGATARLRPGSTLKPFVYGTAMELGDTPATMAYDVVLPEDLGQFYTKDVKQHGGARYREALAGSYNLSAVHALQRAGLPRVLRKLRSAGLGTLDKADNEYDWGLAIGHAEVRLLDLTAAFTTFGRRGVPIRPRAILSAHNPQGDAFAELVEEGERVFSEEINYQLFDILSDADARKPMFGDRVPMNLGFPVALKTGTTKAYTDLWAIGATTEYTVGVWAGNFDGSPTHQVMSVDGATPLLRAVYQNISSLYGAPGAPPRPDTLVEAQICPVSGKKRGPHCHHSKTELFRRQAMPTETCDWHQEVCGVARTVYPGPLAHWARFYGLQDERPSSCDVSTTASLRILSPRPGARFVLEAHRPAEAQKPPFIAKPGGTDHSWFVDGIPAGEWVPSPGEHEVKVASGDQSASVRFVYE